MVSVLLMSLDKSWFFFYTHLKTIWWGSIGEWWRPKVLYNLSIYKEIIFYIYPWNKYYSSNIHRAVPVITAKFISTGRTNNHYSHRTEHKIQLPPCIYGSASSVTWLHSWETMLRESKVPTPRLLFLFVWLNRCLISWPSHSDNICLVFRYWPWPQGQIPWQSRYSYQEWVYS